MEKIITKNYCIFICFYSHGGSERKYNENMSGITPVPKKNTIIYTYNYKSVYKILLFYLLSVNFYEINLITIQT